MSTDYSEFHDDLRAVARQVLSQNRDGNAPACAGRPLLAESGWFGLEVPSPLGGADATFAEVAVVLEEMGRVAAVSGYVGAAVLGIGALRALPSGPAHDGLLAAAASGVQVVLVLPVGGEGETPDAHFTLEPSGTALRLTGRAGDVLDATTADRLLIPARSGSSVVLVDLDPAAAGVDVAAQPLVDETRHLGTVTTTGVVVEAGSVLPFDGDTDSCWTHVRHRGTLAMACDSLGLAEAMLEASVAYTSLRHQFGRPIGSFQAVQHACADMLVRISLSRELIAEAVRRVVADDPEEWVAVSMATSYACTAGVDVAGKAMQLHGGIGYTWESGIHAFLKRATLNRALFGSPGDHRRRLGDRYLSTA